MLLLERKVPPITDIDILQHSILTPKLAEQQPGFVKYVWLGSGAVIAQVCVIKEKLFRLIPVYRLNVFCILPEGNFPIYQRTLRSGFSKRKMVALANKTNHVLINLTVGKFLVLVDTEGNSL